MCSPFEFFDVLEDVKCPDVSLDDVELSDDGEDWAAKFETLEPPPFNVLESCYFDNAENDTKTNNITTSSNEDPQIISDTSSGKKYVPTCSPVSVLDSNSTISRLIEIPMIPPPKRPRSKRKVSRRRTFNSLIFTLEKTQHVSNSEGDVGGEIRRCTHCQGSKTPQWREGPSGPKTLCNACGVRYRSGRLFPEYRPVASPTFSPSLHSNSHRKVLEMRKKSCQFSVPSTAEYLYS